jgi:beta-carotene 3-hydroxylase
MNLVPGLALAASSFVAMEVVSYTTHRYVMHGIGWAWHHSHHAPPHATFERNDWFPVCFAAVGFALFLVASLGSFTTLFWIASGVAAYGAAYAFVHDVCIHRRLSVAPPRGRYFEWLRAAHACHHEFGGEPYGMLLPVLSRRFRASHPVRGRDRDRGPDRLDRSHPRDPTPGSRA